MQQGIQPGTKHQVTFHQAHQAEGLPVRGVSEAIYAKGKHAHALKQNSWPRSREKVTLKKYSTMRNYKQPRSRT